MMLFRLQIAILAMLAVSGCAFPTRVAKLNSDQVHLGIDEHTESKTVWVIGHGWHTGLVMRSSDISTNQLPEIGDVSDTDFVELGWGDEGFYNAKKITVPLVVKALLWPTPSVLHVAGFQGEVDQVFRHSDIIKVKLSNDQFDKMCEFVSNTFAQTENGASISLGPGLYGESTFYRAKGKYYAPKTCNVWTARALKNAGCVIVPQIAATAENVIFQTRLIGEVVQKKSPGLKNATLPQSD